jgi:hypothetical protein
MQDADKMPKGGKKPLSEALGSLRDSQGQDARRKKDAKRR